MNSKLLKEFEEFEGLTGVAVDDNIIEEKDDDDPSMRPTNASLLSINDVYYELEQRGKKGTGFPDTDREMLQKIFDEEFKNSLEEMKAKRREKLRKAAQQLGLQKRRLMMEKSLQEEQDALAMDHQTGLVIDLIKENHVQGSIRINVNSITARSLAKAMWINDSVTCLDLSCNNLDDHAGTYLARVLKRNQTLQKLELDNNSLSIKSGIAFGEALSANHSLKYLSLDSNPLISSMTSNQQDISGISAIADALKSNTTLTSMNLWRTGLSIDCGTMLANALDQNSTLLFMDIGQNFLDIGDVRRIVEKLDDNLARFEEQERERRRVEALSAEQRQKEENERDAQRKQVEQAKWLQERREQRVEEKRLLEQQRIFRLQEELEEKKRLHELQLLEEKKALEAANEKKGKKKGDKKKK